MVHLSGNTSRVSKSSSDWLDYTAFPGDVFVTFFNIPPGNKDAVAPNSPHERRKPSNAYQGQLNGAFSNVCEIFKVRGIEIFKIRLRVSHTGLLLWRHFHTPKRDAKLNEL